MRYPWQKGWKPKPLAAGLYSMAQRMAAEGLVPRDHPVWALSEQDERRVIAELATPEQVIEEWAVDPA